MNKGARGGRPVSFDAHSHGVSLLSVGSLKDGKPEEQYSTDGSPGLRSAKGQTSDHTDTGTITLNAGGLADRNSYIHSLLPPLLTSTRRSLLRPRICSGPADGTGKEYYDGVQAVIASQGSTSFVRPGFKKFKDDVTGHWYSVECDFANLACSHLPG